MNCFILFSIINIEYIKLKYCKPGKEGGGVQVNIIKVPIRTIVLLYSIFLSLSIISGFIGHWIAQKDSFWIAGLPGLPDCQIALKNFEGNKKL